MTRKAQAVLHEALSLPEEDLRELVGGLLRSLETRVAGTLRPRTPAGATIELPLLPGHQLVGELPSRAEIYDEMLEAKSGWE